MPRKVTDAEAHAMVVAAAGPDPKSAASARSELVRWTKGGTEFECEATRRWVAHTVMIHGFE